LGALDLQLRRQMQIELKRLQKRLGITFIYITHDQEEALNMSDRIAVMKNGVFQQVGSPSEIYDRPRNSYVASFVGSANVLRGKVLRKEGDLFIEYAGGIAPFTPLCEVPPDGAPVAVAVRSEYIDFLPPDAEGIPAVVKEKSFAAGMLRIALSLENGDEIVASRHGIDSGLSSGDRVVFSFAREHAVAVEDEDAK
ncbi:MAG: ABC transporter ATP-binding protein, partial [Clostridia bacterium]|nr:ABC transporter ATP-binding protein [Clostridia bacterium]